MTQRLVFVFLVTTLGYSIANTTLPIGDPRACQTENQGQFMFEVLPGLGWDNLVNENRGLVVNYNYSKCKTTEDRRYLIPDGIVTIPIKTSSMNVFSTIYDHWSNYTTDTSFSINTGASASFSGVKISASFSTEYEHVKSHQIKDKSVSVKAQARYVRYTAKVLPDAQLDKSFRSRLLKIATHIQHNRQLSARYESELIVRDFGTHVLTSVDAGASVVKLDQIKSSLLQDSTMDRFQISMAASASVFSIFSADISSKFSVKTTTMQKYMQSITNSDIKTYGGPALDPVNFTLQHWTADIGNDLVAVDRNGFPLDYVITKEALPELSESLIDELSQNIREAISTYVKHNTYPGCTDLEAPNFSYIANVDDGTCHTPYTNLSFGGVYQTCEFTGSLINGENLCSSLLTKNPKTQDFSCPDGYEETLLYTGKTSKSQQQHQCHRCWIFFHCCHDQHYYGAAKYNAYWCRAKPNTQIAQGSGFLFGGLYSDKTANFVTQSKSCPPEFYPYTITANVHVCLSDDFELGTKNSVPFGGFYSCQHGNPLTKSHGNTKTCPSGYSNHLATIDNSCEINYCVQTGSLSGLKFPTVKLPPFTRVPAESLSTPANYIISQDGELWIQMVDPTTKNDEPEEEKWTTLQSAKREFSNLLKSFDKNNVVYSGNDKGMSKGAIAGLSVGLTTLVCVVVGIVFVMRRNRRRNAEYRTLE